MGGSRDGVEEDGGGFRCEDRNDQMDPQITQINLGSRSARCARRGFGQRRECRCFAEAGMVERITNPRSILRLRAGVEFGAEGFGLVGEGGPFGEDLLKLVGDALVGAGGLAEFVGIAADFRFGKVLGESGLGGFEIGDLALEDFEFGIERFENLGALAADLCFAFAAFLGGKSWGCDCCGGRGLGLCRRGLAAFQVFLLFLFVEVVAEVAEVEFGVLALAELEGLFDAGVEEGAVVGDDDDGAFVVLDGVLEDLLRLHVEVVGRFVENKEVGRADEHADEGDAGALAAGENADLFENIVSAEEETAEEVADLGGSLAAGDFLDGGDDGLARVEFVGVVLGEEGGLHAIAELAESGAGGFLAGDEAAEG